jgi:methylated-DNA-[protein]-cysteine S-methyltransferase
MKDYCYYDSPIGRILLVGEGGVLEELHFPNAAEHLQIPKDWRNDTVAFAAVLRQLGEYFAGDRQEFDLALAPRGTPFQVQVWQELRRVPYGHTASYGAIAERIGNPKACRAIGMANSKNPIPIIIPCHRIIGKDGSLTGFGGGLAVKKQLLDLERQALVHLPRQTVI